MTSTGSTGTRAEAITIALLVLLAGGIVGGQWIGLLGSDDLSYAAAARDWIGHFPSLAQDHWALRYPVVFPLVLTFLLGGVREFTLILPDLLYFVATLAAIYVLVRRYFGMAEAAAAVAVIMTMPITPTLASTLVSDPSEFCFDILSLLFFLRSLDSANPVFPVLCGLAAGIGFLSRETTVVILLFYGLCFLFRPMAPRSRYVVIFACAAGVVAAQTVYLWSRSGDWLWRQHLDIHHDKVNRVAQLLKSERHGFVLDSEGNLTVNPFVDPLLALFAAPKYGLLFWFAVAAGIACLRDRAMRMAQRRAVRVIAAVACLWALFIFANFEILYLVPRYIYFSALLASILIGIFFVRLWRARARVGVVLMAAALAGCGLLLMVLQDADPLFADRGLARYAAASDEPIYVDARAAGPVNFLLAASGSARRVIEGEPPPGSLAAVEVAPFYQRRGGAAVIDPRKDAVQPVARIERAMRLPGRLAADVGVAPYLPSLLWRKIAQPSPVLFIYRRLPAPANAAAMPDGHGA